MKQIVFDSKNIQLYYWSPYIELFILKDNLKIYSLLTDTTIIIQTSKSLDLANVLEQGVTYQQLFEFLKREVDEDSPESCIRTLFEYKMIE